MTHPNDPPQKRGGIPSQTTLEYGHICDMTLPYDPLEETDGTPSQTTRSMAIHVT